MKGAKAGTLAITIRIENNSNITISGISQNFFLVFKKSKSSLRNSIGLIKISLKGM